jgi:hypothetical protein
MAWGGLDNSYDDSKGAMVVSFRETSDIAAGNMRGKMKISPSAPALACLRRGKPGEIPQAPKQ